MRNTNNKFPRISPYRIHMQHKGKGLFPHYVEWINRIGEIVDENRLSIPKTDHVNVIKKDIENVRNYKLGNCGESCSLTIASLIANGIKNFKIGLLTFDIDIRRKGQKEDSKEQRNYNTTHEMIILNSDDTYLDTKSNKQDIIVLDAWLGFCGNLQKAIDIFYENFLNGSRNYNNGKGYECTYKPKIKLHNVDIDITDKLTKTFAKKYPELVIENNNKKAH